MISKKRTLRIEGKNGEKTGKGRKEAMNGGRVRRRWGDEKRKRREKGGTR